MSFATPKYVRLHWKQLLWEVVRDSVVALSMAMAFSDSILEVVPEHTTTYHAVRTVWDYVFDNPWLLLCIILVIVIGALILHWPRTKAIYKDANSDLRVVIECCDLLEQKGMKVIHSVDTFDTVLGTVISERSLHGSFLKKVQRFGIDIDPLIDQSLRNTAVASIDESLPCRQKRYELGTVCPVMIQDEPYGLVSFSHLSADGNIALTLQEYTNFLQRMWRELSNPKIRYDELNVAVMGNKFIDLPAEFSTEQKIDLMLQTFFTVARERVCCKTLRICVHPSNVTEVDFEHYPTIIRHLAKRPVTI